MSLTGRLGALSLMCILSVSPGVAWGTAGFAESHSELGYNRYASLHWIHPGDGCDTGANCFFVTKKEKGWFRDLYGSLQKINVPEEDTALIIAQRSGGTWLVYDLKAERYLVQSASAVEASSVWARNGLRSPTFADAERAQGLHRTWRSRSTDWGIAIILWLPLVLPLIVLFGLVAGSVLTWRFVKRGELTRFEAWLCSVVAVITVPPLVVIVSIALAPAWVRGWAKHAPELLLLWLAAGLVTLASVGLTSRRRRR